MLWICMFKLLYVHVCTAYFCSACSVATSTIHFFFSSFMRHFKLNYLSHMTWCTQEAKIKKTTACVTFVCVERLLIASNYWSWILLDFNSGMVGGLAHDLQFKSTHLVWKKINFSMWGFWIEIHITVHRNTTILNRLWILHSNNMSHISWSCSNDGRLLFQCQMGSQPPIQTRGPWLQSPAWTT